MIGKRGISTTFLIGLGIALALLGMMGLGLFIYFEGSAGFSKLARYLPGFGDINITPGGVALVGIDLTDDLRLKYYDGSSWVLITEDKFILGDKEIDRDVFEDELKKFYLATPRKGNDFALLDDGVTQLRVVPNKDFGLARIIDGGFGIIDSSYIFDYFGGEYQISGGGPAIFRFVQPSVYMIVKEERTDDFFKDEEEKDLFIDIFGKVYERKQGVFNKGDIKGVDFRDISKYFGAVAELIRWRDQILEGKQFEAYITLSYNKIIRRDRKDPVTWDYVVKRIDNILFVDLDLEVFGVDEYHRVEFVEEDGEETERQVVAINLDFALQEAERRSGDYSDNKEFVDWLYDQGFISYEDYDEINGAGLFNLEEDMNFVVDLLRQKEERRAKRAEEIERGKKTEDEIIQDLGLIPVIRGEEGEEFVDYYLREGEGASDKYYILEYGHVYYTGTALPNEQPQILLNDGDDRWWNLVGTSISYTNFELGESVIGPKQFSGYFEFDELGNIAWDPEKGDYVYLIDPYKTWHNKDNQERYNR